MRNYLKYMFLITLLAFCGCHRSAQEWATALQNFQPAKCENNVCVGNCWSSNDCASGCSCVRYEGNKPGICQP